MTTEENLLESRALSAVLQATQGRASQEEVVQATLDFLQGSIPRGTLEDRLIEVAARKIIGGPLPEIDIYERDQLSSIAASWNRWARGERRAPIVTFLSSEGHLDQIVLDSWGLAVAQLSRGEADAQGSFLLAVRLSDEYHVYFRKLVLWSYAASFYC